MLGVLTAGSFLLCQGWALAFNYDDLILLVQAEQKQYGSAKTTLSLDERLRNLETSVFGSARSGSESKRLRDVCRSMGILKPEPAAAVKQPSVNQAEKAAAVEKAKNEAAARAQAEKSRKKQQRKFEMPAEISRQPVAQPMVPDPEPVRTEPKPMEAQPLEPQPPEQQQVPPQPKQPESDQQQPLQHQPQTQTATSVDSVEQEQVIPGQSSSQSPGLGSLLPIILLGVLVLIIFGVAGGAAFLIIRERKKAAQPFEPVSEDELPQAGSEEKSTVSTAGKAPFVRPESSPSGTVQSINLEPPPPPAARSTTTEREITWTDPDTSSLVAPAVAETELDPLQSDPNVFAVKNKVFKISVAGEQRKLHPIARDDHHATVEEKSVNSNTSVPFAPYTTDPHSADSFLFQNPPADSSQYAPPSRPVANQQSSWATSFSSTASDESLDKAVSDLLETTAGRENVSSKEDASFDSTPSPYAFAPPLPTVQQTVQEMSVEEPVADVVDQLQTIDGALPDAPPPVQTPPSEGGALSAFDQAQARLDALLGKPPAPPSTNQLFLPDESLQIQPKPEMAAPVAATFAEHAAITVEVPTGFGMARSDEFGAIFDKAGANEVVQDTGAEAAVPVSAEVAYPAHSLQDTSATADSREDDAAEAGAVTGAGDQVSSEEDGVIYGAPAASAQGVDKDVKLHSALQKLNRAYGVLPDVNASQAPKGDVSPLPLLQGVETVSNSDSSNSGSSATSPGADSDAQDDTGRSAQSDPDSDSLPASSLPKSFAQSLAGVLGMAGIARPKLGDDVFPDEEFAEQLTASPNETSEKDAESTDEVVPLFAFDESDSVFVQGTMGAEGSLDEAITAEYSRRDSDDSVFERMLRTLFADDDFQPELFPNLATTASSAETANNSNLTVSPPIAVPSSTPLRSGARPAATSAPKAENVTPGPGLYGESRETADMVRSDSSQYQGQLRNLFAEVSKDDRLLKGEYQAVIYETQPGCLILVVDQSAGMQSALNPGSSACKSDIVAVVINRFIHRLIKRCKSENGKIRASWYVGIIGYGESVGPAYIGKHAGKDLVNVSDLSTTVDYVVPDRPKSTIVGIPVWVRPKAAGPARMCGALSNALKVARDFVADNPTSHPPIIVNISGGGVADGDPRPLANAIKEIQSADGNVLLFNVCLPGRPDEEMLNFPDDPSQLPEHAAARALWDMSSPLLIKMIHMARDYQIDISPRARGFAWNSDVNVIAGLLEMCTAET